MRGVIPSKILMMRQGEDKVANSSRKYTHLEIMRIIAIFFVIFNHTGEDGFVLFRQVPAGGLLFWIYLFVSVFCKLSVPLFLAISGAVMLARPEESVEKIWRYKIPRTVLILIVYSVGYYCYDAYRYEGILLEWKNFWIGLYTGNLYYLKYHLWYLYLYIAYLAVFPFLKAMATNLKDKYFICMLFLAILFQGILPVLEYFFSKGESRISSNIKISWLLDSAVLYPCLGYYMQHRLDYHKLGKKIPVLWILNVAGIIVSCYMTFYKAQNTGEWTEGSLQTFHNCFVVLNCVSVFTTIRFLFEKRKLPDAADRIILSLGGCTFGIYLWHIGVKERPLFGKWLRGLQAAGLNYMIAIFIMCFVVLFISYVITLILSKIPLLKKLV